MTDLNRKFWRHVGTGLAFQAPNPFVVTGEITTTFNNPDLVHNLRAQQEKQDRRWLIISRIVNRVEVSPEGCWLWLGSHSGEGRGGGYGRMSLDGHTVSVHRTMYAALYGPIPGRKQIDHTCCNRLCCNPSHLEMVTHKQNQRRRRK